MGVRTQPGGAALTAVGRLALPASRATLRRLSSSLVAAAILAVGASSADSIAPSSTGRSAAQPARAVRPAVVTAIASGAVEDADVELPARAAPSLALPPATPSIVAAPGHAPDARDAHSGGCTRVARWCLGHATATAET